MICKEHTVHIPDFAFIPIGRFENFTGRFDWCQFVGVCFDANTWIIPQRQKVIDNLEEVIENGLRICVRIRYTSWSWLTSKRYFRLGTSKPAISAKLANWALWWSFRNCSVGITPSGAIKTSNSSPAVSCTFCTYFGKHSATYFPKSVKLARAASFGLRTVAANTKYSTSD